MEDKKEIVRLRLFALVVILLYGFGSYVIYKSNPDMNSLYKAVVLKH